MRRISILALGVGVALALSASAAASASAEVIQIHVHSHWDAGCLFDEHFCWEGGDDDVTIEVETDHPLGIAKLPASGGNTITNVHLNGTACSSPGEPEGVVETEPVTEELGWINKKKKEVGLEERPTTGDVYARFACGPEAVEMRGGVIGALTPVKKIIKAGGSLTDLVTRTEGGEQAISKFEGGPKTGLEYQVDGGGFQEAPTTDPSTITVSGGTLEVKAGKTPEFVLKPSKVKK